VSRPRPDQRAPFTRFGLAVLLALALGGGGAADSAHAASASDPLFIFTPRPEPPPHPAIPPPAGYLSAPCGLAVDSGGRFYVADYYHDAVDVYDPNADYTTPPVYGSRGYLGQLRLADHLDGPCGLSLDASGNLYVNTYHQAVQRYGPLPGFAAGPVLSGRDVDSATPTGVAVDPPSGDAYVDERSQVGVYDSSGAAVEEGGEPVRIGLGSLGEGYGLAHSAYPATAGYIYVPDASTDTVLVYDPATSPTIPVRSISGPPGGFSSLRDASVAVDRLTGEVYVTDNLQPHNTETPHALIDVFDSSGNYEGHLKYEVVDGMPSGLAVDNSETGTQGRVYVTSGNTYFGAIYAYPPGAATTTTPLIGPAPAQPLGANSLFQTVSVGARAGGAGQQIACEGDSCQVLPPEPVDPALSTKVSGLGNPRVRYHRYGRRRGKGHTHKRHQGRHASRALASASPLRLRPSAASSARAAAIDANRSPSLASLAPAPSGFEARVVADGGSPAVLAGSHPYTLELSLGLEQGGANQDLRQLSLTLPAGLLADPAATPICEAVPFSNQRSSPFEASQAGESCQEGSQVGTLQATDGSGEVRRFGLFNLAAPEGTAARLGAAPFGSPITFDVHLIEGARGTIHLRLESSEISPGLALHGLELTLWGTPQDASHDGERGDCLNETEPSFPWARCGAVSVPLVEPPVALLTLPSECGEPLTFAADGESWSGARISEDAPTRDPGGQPVPVEGCETLHFEPPVSGALTTKHVSSSAGFALHLSQDDPGFINPRSRAEPRAREGLVNLPRGVTLNPSLAAGLEGCTEAQIAATSLTAQGCPNGSKIGTLSLTLPFYRGEIKGAIYLAKPIQNPYGSLLAIYLVARAADRGILLKAQGKLTPDPADGTLTAHLEGLTQLPYSELRLEFRAGQRSALVSPPLCGPAPTEIQLSAWSGAEPPPSRIESPLEAGIEGEPCPTDTAPFQLRASAGGINSNANSYTPYFIHLSRSDSEQEITSYSMVLPAGITGKLAGIPFCPEAAIDAARKSDGFVEAAHPSCAKASQVGRTVTGYGVGPTLAYSEGKVYLAGPYHGAPLSLVTINPATVGPFDLGTIVVRSAFDLDPRTAQLRIDSSASDPIPHILDGVVLHLRDIRVYLDRPEFTHNPTSCEPSQLLSTLTGSGASFAERADDSTASVSERFQLLNCRNLGFRPKLGLRLFGSTDRGSFPALRASFVSRGARDANLRRIEVDMPHQLFLAQSHIRTVCTRAAFDAERCPPSSVYGKAAAHTPLLDEPLRGAVYLRSSSHKLPDLVADLRSGSIRIIVEGRIGPSGQGGIRAFFDDLPDAPITRFTMLLSGGRRGLLTNSVNVCKRAPLVAVKALGQNDVGATFTSLLRGQCKGGKG
jgi:DNA-binding beta-propeller fold protein YncE